MSSEESGDEDFITTQPLPWCSEYVTKIFSKIDGYIMSQKSCQTKRQMKACRVGNPSALSIGALDGLLR